MNRQDAYLTAVRYARDKHRDERTKLIKAAQVAHSNGVPVRLIAAQANVTERTVYRWIKINNETEGSTS